MSHFLFVSYHLFVLSAFVLVLSHFASLCFWIRSFFSKLFGFPVFAFPGGSWRLGGCDERGRSTRAIGAPTRRPTWLLFDSFRFLFVSLFSKKSAFSVSVNIYLLCFTSSCLVFYPFWNLSRQWAKFLSRAEEKGGPFFSLFFTKRGKSNLKDPKIHKCRNCQLKVWKMKKKRKDAS